MTELLYYDDAYLKTFDAVVQSCTARVGAVDLVLDRTAFYPGGGGQPADTGVMRIHGLEQPVIKVQREQGEIVHRVAWDGPIPPPQPGAVVAGELNWTRRYRIMRTHTAMHILCGVVWRDYGASVTGGNMEPGEGRMDFEFAALSRDLVGEIEAKCNAEVQAAHAVTSRILPREAAFEIPDLIRTKINLLPEGIAQVRVVELEGLDLQADGGTHVANTREVGQMAIADYKSKGAINKRIYIKLSGETGQ